MLTAPITIEFRDEPVSGCPGAFQSGYWVTYGDRTADCLTFEEMLGLVASLTGPDDRRCLQWLQTQEQRDARAKRLEAMREHREAEAAKT